MPGSGRQSRTRARSARAIFRRTSSRFDAVHRRYPQAIHRHCPQIPQPYAHSRAPIRTFAGREPARHATRGIVAGGSCSEIHGAPQAVPQDPHTQCRVSTGVHLSVGHTTTDHPARDQPLETRLDHHSHHPRHPGHHRDEPRQDQPHRKPVRSGVRDRNELLRSDLRSGLHGRSARPVRRSLKTGLRHPPRRSERRALSTRLQVPLRTPQNPVGLRGHPKRLYGALVTAQLVRHRPRTSSYGPWRPPARARAPRAPRAWSRRRERRRAMAP